MDFLINELSIHGQFQNVTTFREAFALLVKMRGIVTSFGTAVFCHTNISNAQLNPTTTMREMVQELSHNERRLLMSWFQKQGPFWDIVRNHQGSDYLDFQGQIVTDSALGEAAFCTIQGIDRHLLSVVPSNWEFSPIPVTYFPDHGDETRVDVFNHTREDTLIQVLEAAPLPIKTWRELEEACATRFPKLVIGFGAFDKITPHPYVESAAKRILTLLAILNRFKNCFNEVGERTAEGHEIYEKYFTGENALFSDSSNTEKREHEEALKFRIRELDEEEVSCPMHGKVRGQNAIRVHFSWPVRADEPLFVVYIGPKLTKQ